MPKTYCGRFQSPPKKKTLGSENQCLSRRRLYGTYMTTEEESSKILAQKLLKYTASRGSDVYCGYKHESQHPHGRADACKRHVARYGLFPYIASKDDLDIEVYHPPVESAMPGNIRNSLDEDSAHAYVYNIYDKTDIPRRAGKADVMMIVATSKHLTEKQKSWALSNIFTSRGVIGHAFGYFSRQNYFEIVRVYVNMPYRSTAQKQNMIASHLLVSLREEAAKRMGNGLGEKVIRIDPEAPCFKFKSTDRWIVQRYESAGFTIEPIITNRANSLERTAIYREIGR